MKKTAAKKTPAKKTAKKAAAKKAPAKKTPAKKTAAKKAPAKKTPAKKTPAKKTAAKKTPAKKTAAKKTAAKKTAAKKTAAEKTPARSAPTPPPAPLEAPNLGSRLAAGDHLIVSLGDNDALDRYTFMITRFDDDGLAVAWQMEGVGDHGDIIYTRHALDEARNLTLMSQGGTMYAEASDSDERVDGSMPPFLVSRAFLRALHDGAATCLVPAIDQEHTYRVIERGPRTITFGGAEITVPTLTAATDEDAEIVVVDDPTFPLVLRRAEWDEDLVRFHEHR